MQYITAARQLGVASIQKSPSTCVIGALTTHLASVAAHGMAQYVHDQHTVSVGHLGLPADWHLG